MSSGRFLLLTFTAIGWFLAFVCAWGPSMIAPFLALALMATCQSWLLGPRVNGWTWAAATIVGGTLGLAFFLSAIAQFKFAIAFGLAACAGLVNVLFELPFVRRMRESPRAWLILTVLSWPAALAAFLIVSRVIGSHPAMAPYFIGAFIGIANGVLLLQKFDVL
jgi:hypothetical protein